MVVPSISSVTGHQDRRVLLRLDTVLIAATFVGALLWIERGHHVNIDPPVQTELGPVAPAAACPDNDNVPYSASCLTFLKGATETGMRWRIKASDGPAVPITVPAPTAAFNPAVAVCPETDSVPYGAKCLAFLKGTIAPTPN